MRPPTRNDGTLPSLNKQHIDHYNHRHIHTQNHRHSHQDDYLAPSSPIAVPIASILSEEQEPRQTNLDVPRQHSSSILGQHPEIPTTLASSSSYCSSENLNEVKLLTNIKHSNINNSNTKINDTLTPCTTSEVNLLYDKCENVISCQPSLATRVVSDHYHNHNANLNLHNNIPGSFASNGLTSTANNINIDNNDCDNNVLINKIDSDSDNSNVAINCTSDNNQKSVRNWENSNGRCKSSPLLVPDKNNSLTLVKNSASLIFTKKNNIPQIVHRKKSTLPNSRQDKTNLSNTNRKSSGVGGFSLLANCANDFGIHLEQPAKLNILKNRQSLQIYSDLDYLTDKKISDLSGNSTPSSSSHRLAERKHQSHSWYAPVYARLDEEIDTESRDSSPLHNLACAKKQSNHGGSHETASLLEASQTNTVSKQPPHHHISSNSSSSNSRTPKIHTRRTNRKSSPVPPLTLNLLPQDGPQLATTVSIGGQQQNVVTTTSTPLQSTAPQPKCSRFEQLIKNLVGRKVSRESSNISNVGVQQQQPLSAPVLQYPHQQLPPLIPSPEIHITKSPSEHTLLKNDKITSSTVSLNTSVQKLWNVVPLLRRDTSCTSLNQIKSTPLLTQYTGLKKCDTVIALSRSTSSNLEPIKPQNRLRNSSSSTITCSRCSSLLSLAANGSRYSLNLSNGGGFIPVGDKCLSISPTPPQPPPLPSSLPKTISATTTTTTTTTTMTKTTTTTTPTSMITTKPISPSPTDIFASETFLKYSQKPTIDPIIISTVKDSFDGGSKNAASNFNLKMANQEPFELIEKDPNTLITEIDDSYSIFMCKLCLLEVNSNQTTVIVQCGCNFCTECMAAYVEFEILEGAYEISCPDALCPAQGVLTLDEITKLCSSNSLDKHNRYRLNREVELDKTRTWCPRAGCETVCTVGGPTTASITITTSSSSSSTSAVSSSVMLQKTISKTNIRTTTTLATTPQSPCSVHCPTCLEEFCSGCKKSWHPTMSCEENTRRLAANGQDDNIGIPFDNDLIKCCPMCAVPIEKDEGCAQMMCKRCKHVFCWYCLASLDDDFLLRHYDRGPCKNKLGHSRASVVWHRAQVIGIFAGFGILLLVASPLLLLAAPCIVCCKCRICNGAAKLEENDNDFDEIIALQR